MPGEAQDAVKHRRRTIAPAYRDVLSMRACSTDSVLLTCIIEVAALPPEVGGRNFLDNQDFERLSNLVLLFFSLSLFLSFFFPLFLQNLA